MAWAVRHWSSVGFVKAGKGEVLACLDQTLYFASSSLELRLDLAVDLADSISSTLACVFALRGLGVVDLRGFVMPFFVP
jgi:hypothetical protein